MPEVIFHPLKGTRNQLLSTLMVVKKYSVCGENELCVYKIFGISLDLDPCDMERILELWSLYVLGLAHHIYLTSTV